MSQQTQTASAMFSVLLATAVVLVLTSPGAHARQAPALTLYVAANGDDAWSGRLETPNADGTDGPLATVTGARDAIRRLKAGQGVPGEVRVLIRGGTYRITEAITFEPQDSGTEDAPVTYAAYPGEKPVISGGRAIGGWEQDGPLWKARLPEVASGDWWFSALFVDGAYRGPARSPNEGFYHTAGKLPESMQGDDSFCGFQFDPGDIRPWRNLEDVLVVVMHSWDVSYHRIRSIDQERHIVTFPGKTYWAFENWGPKQRYFVQHAFEALDQPGEWYLDRKTGTLWYWPRDGEGVEDTEIIAPVASQLVVFKGDLEAGRFVEYIRLEGLRFHHTVYGLGTKGQNNA